MRGYPKSSIGLTKRDYENLLAMPEHAEKAKADLASLAKIDDSKVTQEIGTEEKPLQKQIDNPLPGWKRAGFASRANMITVAGISAEEPVEGIVEEGIKTK